LRIDNEPCIAAYFKGGMKAHFFVLKILAIKFFTKFN